MPPMDRENPFAPDGLLASDGEGQPSGTTAIRMGLRGWLRWSWRQLTSMRVALILLLLLALAAVPGSLVPQRGINEAKVLQFSQQNPTVARWMDLLGLFDVYTSPWFAAVYLLLFISLIGCVIPRTVEHARALRRPPASTPARLSRLPDHTSVVTQISEPAALDRAEQQLRSWGYRVVRTRDAVAAEKGYLRETGNLIFHAALIGILLAVAAGSLFGYRGNVLVREGTGFSNALTQYDTFKPGRLFTPSDLKPFTLSLTNFSVSFETKGKQRGAPREFLADVVVRDGVSAPLQTRRLKVNEPLSLGGARIYLVGWGYAPKVTVRDGEGRVVLRDSVAFLPRDGNFTSTGVIKSPDARPDQLGFQAIFLPTTRIDPERGPISLFPAAVTPGLFMSAWTGDLGLNSAKPQSVFALDTRSLKELGIKALAPGQTWVLPQGRGSITFDGVAQYATLSVARDPGAGPVLLFAAICVTGLVLSLFVHRRRLWVRVTRQPDGTTVAEVAGLTRSEGISVSEQVEELAGILRAASERDAGVVPAAQKEQEQS